MGGGGGGGGVGWICSDFHYIVDELLYYNKVSQVPVESRWISKDISTSVRDRE